MIKSFLHKGLEKFYRNGSKAGIQAKHADRLREQLTALDAASSPNDLAAARNYELHLLKGDLSGHWSIKVSGNWRVTFRFDGTDVILVDYQDYH